MEPRQRAKRGSHGVPRHLAAMMLYCTAYDCAAVDRVTLEVGQVSTAGVQATNATITLDVTPRPDSSSTTLRAQVARLRMPPAGTTYSDIDVSCTDVLVKPPHFACNEASIAARARPTGPIAMNAEGIM